MTSESDKNKLFLKLEEELRSGRATHRPVLTSSDRLTHVKTRACKSAGNSPITSPVISRKVLKNNKTAPAPNKRQLRTTPRHKPEHTLNNSKVAADNLDDTLIVNVTDTSEDTNLNSKKKCPCALSDKLSTYVVCVKCGQEWHNRCCNLDGIPQSAIKKLINWYCPHCYAPPYIAEQPVIPSSANLDIQYVTKPKNQGENIESLSKKISSLDAKVDQLYNVACAHDVDVCSQIAGLEKKIAEVSNISLQQLNITHALDDDICRQVSEVTKKQTAHDNKLHILQNNTELILQSKNCVPPLPSHLIQRQNEADLNPTRSVSPAMTVSAHHTKPTCEPYIRYEKDAVNNELHQSLTKLFNDHDAEFKPIGGCRDTLYFGEYNYRYTGGEHAARDAPVVIGNLIEHLRPFYSDPNAEMNSCLITRYKNGADCIPPHRDDEPFINPTSEIVTVSFGVKRVMKFTDNGNQDIRRLELDDGSVLISSRYCQDFWKHEIEKDESVSKTRYSITLRHMSPVYLNSTALIGDSNTKYLQFGVERGQFGVTMPGKKIEANHIEDVPDPSEIGPYRNVIIHTGINNIKIRNRLSNQTLVNHLEYKCKKIIETYPRCKIYLSLLLPTRLDSLNYRVREFNHLLLDLSHGYRNIFTIDHSIVGNNNGCLDNKFGRFIKETGEPLLTDTLHLGRFGIRKFANTLKTAVKGINRKPKPNYTSNASYRDAARRPVSRDIIEFNDV